MRLTLTIISNDGEINEDIQVNPELKIENMIDILCKNNILKQVCNKDYKLKSIRQGMFINRRLNFEEARVYTGDILEIIT